MAGDTRFFQSSSNVIFQIDVPPVGTMLRERHDEKVAKGELRELIGVTPVKVPARPAEGEPYRWELPSGATAPAIDPTPVEPTPLDEPPAPTGDMPDGNIAEVLAWVDNDPDRAQAALNAERDGKDRDSLIRQLQSVIDG